MRKHFLIFPLVAALLLSCADRAWVGVVEGEYDDSEDLLPVPVLVGVGDPSRSKGSGAVDADDGHPFGDVDLFVYAFNRSSGAPFSSVARTDPSGCILDASLDDPSSREGRRAHFNGTDLYVDWVNASSSTYYPTGSQDAYDFYAYFVDDSPVTRVTRYADKVTMQVEIDGARDIMSGRAAFSEASVPSSFSETEKALLRQRAFSAYTARRGVNPVLNFRHHLTRLRFEIYPSSDEAHTVIINSIRVKSRHTGLFTAVARNQEDEGIDFSQSDYSWLYLPEADGSTLKRNTYHTIEGSDLTPPIYERQPVQVGGTLLVAPDQGYDMEVELFEAKGDGYEGFSLLSLSSAEGFLPGRQYVVRIAIFGMLRPQIQVEMEPWGTGGRIILDDENKFTPK